MSFDPFTEGTHRVEDVERDGDELIGTITGPRAVDWRAEIVSEPYEVWRDEWVMHPEPGRELEGHRLGRERWLEGGTKVLRQQRSFSAPLTPAKSRGSTSFQIRIHNCWSNSTMT